MKGSEHILNEQLEIKVLNESKLARTDYEATIFELQQTLDNMTSQADNLDYFVSVASGILCSLLDIVWTGEFSLEHRRDVASDGVDQFVIKVSKLLGCKEDSIGGCVSYLEEKFPIPSDGNTPDFGGGKQHHLKDFAHHPTIVGLMFSLLTQFTKMSYGTDVNGIFKVVPVPEKSLKHIGVDVTDKILKGTITWFFHLVSDMAGSSSTAGLSGGTGIPGPILSLAKEFSTLPIAQNIQVTDKSLSLFLSKLFNGTMFAKHDENGKIIKESVVQFDLRAELGVTVELGKQALPVVANECIVRTFYLIRRFMNEIKDNHIEHIDEISKISWDKIKPYKNPTLTRMLTISTGVFTTIDIAEAILTQKYWVSVNYVGVGRFTVALTSEMIVFLKYRKVKSIQQMYQNIEKNTYNTTDNNIYERMGEEMDLDRFGLNIKEIEILYNLENQKVINDIEKTSNIIGKENIINLKKEWLAEWKEYISAGFSDFVGDEDAQIKWLDGEELKKTVSESQPNDIWFRLVLLEAMLFEPYYPLTTEKDKKGNDVPCKKYKGLKFDKSEGDKFIDSDFGEPFYKAGYIKRLRICYKKVTKELNEVIKTALISLSVAAGVALLTVITAGAFAPSIAVALVGSNFAGLSGAALTSACLAYLGGGAVAIGGMGMAGGTMAIVGGSAILGLGLGAGVGGAVGMVSIMGKEQTIFQSAKLMVSVREIFLNDEHDVEYSNSILEQYVNNITDIEKGLVELKIKADLASKDEKKKLKKQIKSAEESVNAMKIAMKSMQKYNSSFELGLNQSNG